MAREIEIKFAVEDESKMMHRLLAAGAEKISEGLEHNIVFDNGDMMRRGILLRLRKTGDGKSVMTFKKNIRRSEFKEADEVEIGVSDFSKAKEILRNLGYDIFWVYDKQKTVFGLGSVTVSLDRLAFGTFIEIEGAAGGIRSAMAKLGLDQKNGKTESYLKLYEGYCKEKGIEMENLVLWKKARPNVRY